MGSAKHILAKQAMEPQDMQTQAYVEEFMPGGGGYMVPDLFQSQPLPPVPPVTAVNRVGPKGRNSFVNTFNNS